MFLKWFMSCSQVWLLRLCCMSAIVTMAFVEFGFQRYRLWTGWVRNEIGRRMVNWDFWSLILCSWIEISVCMCVCVCIIYIIILLYILYNRCTHRHVYSQCFLKFLFKEKIKILRLKWTFLDYNFLLPELRIECCFLDSDIFLSTCGKPNKIVPELSTLTTCIDALFL